MILDVQERVKNFDQLNECHTITFVHNSEESTQTRKTLDIIDINTISIQYSIHKYLKLASF